MGQRMMATKTMDGAGNGRGDLSAVILAGGASLRMGRDKAWLEIGGRRLIERQIAVARGAGASEVLVSGRATSNFDSLGVRVLLDEEADRGPMAGVKRAMEVARGSLLLVLAVDLPAMTSGWLRQLIDQTVPGRGAVPQVGQQLEPLAAVYPVAAHSLLGACWHSGRYGMQDFARACAGENWVRLWPVTKDDWGFFANWNRPEDFPAQAQPPTR